jgi:transposase-like protein
MTLGLEEINCPSCGSTNIMHGGYDRDDEGRLADTWQCRDCDDCWNTPA